MAETKTFQIYRAKKGIPYYSDATMVTLSNDELEAESRISKTDLQEYFEYLGATTLVINGHTPYPPIE